MNKIANHTALKEWSTVVDALGRGEQVILLRKGGIADPHFGLEADRFYLYPTYFHQGEKDPRESVFIESWCEVIDSRTTRDAEVLRRLAPMVAMPPEALEQRFRFRPDQALHIIAVRTWRLPAPVEVHYQTEYGGCLSWISLEEEITIDGSSPALQETELQNRIYAITAFHE